MRRHDLDDDRPAEGLTMIDGVSPLSMTAPSLAAPGVSPMAGATGAAAPATGASFGEIMNQVAGDAVNTLKTAEATSIEGLEGSAPVHKVVESIMSAQRSLQTVLALRDKAVAAYQEISRMAI
jgi:flagellar hook-basal body complex protein FliE